MTSNSNGQASGSCTPVVFASSKYAPLGSLTNQKSSRGGRPSAPSRQTTTSSVYTGYRRRVM